MKAHGISLLLAGAGVLAIGAASAQDVDDYGVVQPRTGVTGVGVNDAAPPEITREGGYIPPLEAVRRINEGTLSPDNLLDQTPSASAPSASAVGSGATGYTAAQLDDADLVNHAGMQLGEVEAVLVDPAGAPSAVLVELEDDMFGEERLIEIGLDELTARPAQKYLNIWIDRIDLVSDRPPSWFEAARDWRDQPGASPVSASR
jgi:hypothetical protein